MKKIVIAVAFIFAMSTTMFSCRDKNTKEKVDEAVEAVGDDIKEGAEELKENVKEGAKNVKEEAEELKENIKEGAKEVKEEFKEATDGE